ncbi:MAG: hypothetical protein JSV88_08580 [Candidatus Aminicenantes bacterium]|nr:MAG: hypothetical protein JSV88_08580 [Candidatus Aminicenantes bacterium]
MVIDNFFIHHQTPSQYVYWGENYVDVYRAADADKTFTKILSVDNLSISAITPYQFQDIAKELLKTDTGIILNSGQFIFNIFEFEKLPFQEKLKRELVEWRLKKVFPENIEEYEHNFYKLNKNRVLSLLFKKSLKENIENLFRENGISLTYLGNSTVEMMNHVGKLKKETPDFFIEIDKNLSIAVFLERNLPFYIRKFRSDQAADIVNEVVKTINFLKNSYTTVPRTFSLVVRRSDADIHLVRDELSKMEILPLELKNNEQFIFPI